MFVDRVGGLSWGGRGEGNLEDNVDPGAVFGSQDKVGIMGGGSVWVEEEGGGVIEVLRVAGVAVEGPDIVCAETAEV